MPDPDRDKSVEQWLRQTPVAGARGDDCIDAETLAAWSEGVLAGQERSTAEAHAANCARCQAMLAVMVRTTPAPSGVAGSPLRKWLMMLSPAMAAAAAVALWVAVGQRPAPSAIDELRKGQAKAEPASEVAQAAPAPAVGAEKELRAEPQVTGDARRELGSRVGARTQADRGSAGNERADRSAESKDFAAAARADKSLDAERLRAEAKPAPPPPPSSPRPASESVSITAAAPPVTVAAPGPAPLQQTNQTLNQNQAQNQNQNAQNQNQAPAPNQNAATQNQPPQRQAALEERVIVRDEKALGRVAGATAAEGRSAGRGGAGGGPADASALSFRVNVGTFDVAVPESSIRWRVIDGRTIQRSSDAGMTWASHHAEASDVTLTAGVAPSSNVCWLVGRSGAITLTMDGRVWRRIKFPEPTDLASVIASDGRAATVTAADGRRFATTDGGLTWTRR